MLGVKFSRLSRVAIIENVIAIEFFENGFYSVRMLVYGCNLRNIFLGRKLAENFIGHL